MKQTIRIMIASTFALTLSMGTHSLFSTAYAAEKPGTALQQTSAQQSLVTMPPTYRDVVVDTVKNANGSDHVLKMNVFIPPHTNNKVPALIYVHGGGWAMGDYQGNDKIQTSPKQARGQMGRDNDKTYNVFKSVLDDGIAFISVDYQLNREAQLPAQIYDVKGAIRFVRAHADEYGIDANRIAIGGSSAGAHLASEAALTANIPELEGTVGGNLDQFSAVMACVDYYGPTDLLTMAQEMSPALQDKDKAIETHDSVRANESILVGATGGDKAAGVAELRSVLKSGDKSSPFWNMAKLAANASPVNHVTKDAPPFFIAHGGKDSLVPIAQSLRLQKLLNDAGVENIFVYNSQTPHGYQGETTNAAMRAWLKGKLFSSK